MASAPTQVTFGEHKKLQLLTESGIFNGELQAFLDRNGLNKQVPQIPHFLSEHAASCHCRLFIHAMQCAERETVFGFHYRHAVVWQIHAAQPLVQHKPQVVALRRCLKQCNAAVHSLTASSTMNLVEGQRKTTRGRIARAFLSP